MDDNDGCVGFDWSDWRAPLALPEPEAANPAAFRPWWLEDGQLDAADTTLLLRCVTAVTVALSMVMDLPLTARVIPQRYGTPRGFLSSLISVALKRYPECHAETREGLAYLAESIVDALQQEPGVTFED